MQSLDRIVAKSSQLRVLRVLYHHASSHPLSGRQIQKKCGLSNRATMLALEELMSISVVQMTPSGNAHLFQLNPGHYFVTKAIKPMFEAEVLFWADLGKTVRRKVTPRPVAAIATGAPVRTETLLDGKIELVIIFSTGRNRIRAYPSLEGLKQAVFERHALTIDPVLIDVNSMYREENNALWRRIEREGIQLFGKLN